MKPVVLASTSSARSAILKGAGVLFEAMSANVDEDAMKAGMRGSTPAQVAVALADAKAIAVSARRPDAVVIGADQTLDLGGAPFDKVDDLAEARARLIGLRGKMHHLHSAVAVAEAGAVTWRTLESPNLTMRAVSDAWLDGYLARGGEALLGSVGCYLLEGEGAQLFEAIEGNYFAILGLPLLPLLAALRDKGALAA